MGKVPLTLKDFAFVKTEVNIEEIRKFKTEDQFTSLAVELLKEVGKITALLANTYRLDENNRPRRWTRNEAIVGGLMIRISKLLIALLDQTCQKRREIVEIIARCIAESQINLRYLLKTNSEEVFNEYIEYSLREEKRLLNKINKNITERGYELYIEKRMRSSILRAFKTSSFSPDLVNEEKWGPWEKKLYERAEDIGLGEEYFAICSLLSHAVHGNWQDLITHHVAHEDGEFSPESRWTRPVPQIILAVITLSIETDRLYLDDAIPECPDREEIQKLLKDLNIRVKVLSELHEQFLQKKQSNKL